MDYPPPAGLRAGVVAAAGCPVALRRVQRLWMLYHHRHTGRWEGYPLLGPSRRLGDLLSELTEDPICVFWR